MKFYVVLAVTVTVILGAFFYMKHQDQQRKDVAALESAELARMRGASLQAEQAEAAMSQSKKMVAAGEGLSASANVAGNEGGILAAMTEQMGTQAGSLKNQQTRPQRVKVAFEGQSPNMKRKQKKFDHFEEEFVGGPDNDEGFQFSSAQYSHTKFKADRVGSAGGLSDDLLIVESRLEESADSARR